MAVERVDRDLDLHGVPLPVGWVFVPTLDDVSEEAGAAFAAWADSDAGTGRCRLHLGLRSLRHRPGHHDGSGIGFSDAATAGAFRARFAGTIARDAA